MVSNSCCILFVGWHDYLVKIADIDVKSGSSVDAILSPCESEQNLYDMVIL